MPQNLLEPLRARRTEIQEEMRIRLDELDRLIALVADSEQPDPNPGLNPDQGSGTHRRRRGEEVKIGDIIERPIMAGLLAAPALTTKEMANLLPGKRIGPLVSAWKRRSVAAGVVFDDLVERSMTPSGDVAFSLTAEGRRVFGSVARTESALVQEPASAGVPTAQQPHSWPTLTSAPGS